MSTRPTLSAELAWDGGLRFRAVAAGQELLLDGETQAAVSPVQALGISLAACMAIDVVHILTKGRHPPSSLRVHFFAERAASEPRRIETAELRFEIGGALPSEAVDRALALSREKYCSVWHSLRPDIELRTSFELLQ